MTLPKWTIVNMPDPISKTEAEIWLWHFVDKGIIEIEDIGTDQHGNPHIRFREIPRIRNIQVQCSIDWEK